MLYVMLGILFAVIASLMILVMQGEHAKEKAKAALASKDKDPTNPLENRKDSRS